MHRHVCIRLKNWLTLGSKAVRSHIDHRKALKKVKSSYGVWPDGKRKNKPGRLLQTKPT